MLGLCKGRAHPRVFDMTLVPRVYILKVVHVNTSRVFPPEARSYCLPPRPSTSQLPKLLHLRSGADRSLVKSQHSTMNEIMDHAADRAHASPLVQSRRIRPRGQPLQDILEEETDEVRVREKSSSWFRLTWSFTTR